VQVIGVDTYNGTEAQLRNFKNVTGATYPLLLNGSLATGGNVEILYGTYDNYIVINKQGIVRYHAADIWPHGNRYHLNEIRGAVDSLVTPTVDVEPGPGASGFSLSAAPNPFRGAAQIAFAHGESSALLATVTVHDLAGRRIVTLHDGPVTAGVRRVSWSGLDSRGEPMRPGVYLVRAAWPGRVLTCRIVSVQ
jgi:hypothetical protein